MKFSQEKMPYLNTEGNIVDFNKKRLQFWLETVPENLRRMEFEFYKRKRRIINANIFHHEHKKKHGKFTFLPGFTDDIAKYSWEKFRDSFLLGEERKERFAEILKTVQNDIPKLIEKNSKIIAKDKIRLIALSGSSIIGPRRQGEQLSDVDINFLMDEETDKLNFDILPDNKFSSEETPYHLLGTGYSDNARGNREFHWLLYPHFPIQNSIPDEELKDIIQQLVVDTEERKDKILESIKRLDDVIEEKSQDEIVE